MRTVCALLVASCVSSSNYWIAYRPARGNVDGDGAHRRAVLALTDMGKSIETNDAASGIVVTAWEDGRNSFGKMRVRFRVSVDGSAYDVAAPCEQFVDGPGNDAWQPCDEATRPRWVVEDVERIAGAIR